MDGRWRTPFRSLVFKLVIYMILAGIVPFTAAIFYYNHQMSNRALEAYVQQAEQSHQYVIQHFQYKLTEMAAVAEALAGDLVVQDYFFDLDQYPTSDPIENEEESIEQNTYEIIDQSLERRLYIHEQILRQSARLGEETQICLLIKDSDRSICIYPDTRFADVEMFDAALGEDSMFTPIDTRFSHNRKEYEMMYVKAMFHPDIEVSFGQVIVIINVNRVMEEAGYLEQNIAAGMMMYNQEGQILYRHGFRAGRELRSESNAVGTEVTTQTITTRRAFLLNGEEWISLRQTKNQYSGNTTQTFIQTTLLFLLLLTLLCAGGAFIFSRYIAKPLHRLRTLMNRAERGDLKAYWVHDNSQEIDEVGQSYNQMLNRLEDLINQVKKEEALKKEAEIAALQYQLNPHFLYNTLNTIKWVAKIHKTPQIAEAVSALVRLLQASLGKKGDFITLREEVGLINDYMEIQRFRYGDRVKVEFALEPMTEQCLVPRMILQPLVENACIHGIEPGKKEGLIKIRAWIDRDLLFCQVEDNGIGMDPQYYEEATGKFDGIKERMSGIGLQHIREKIKLYYGQEYKMHVISKKGKGTTIRLSLPIHLNESD